MAKKDWWQKYDNGFGAILFQEPRIYKPSNQFTQMEVELILRATKPKPSAVFLDIACGVGRHSLSLARQGFNAVGLDYSSHYTAIAKKEAKRLGVSSRARFICADMRCLSDHVESSSIDIVLCLWNSFGVFKNKSDDLRVLRQVAQVVRPGGFFVLSTFNHSGVRYRNLELPQKMETDARYRWIEYRPKKLFLEKAHFDLKKSKKKH